jgi:hypothetical protein
MAGRREGFTSEQTITKWIDPDQLYPEKGREK